ncbi:hypothetical protein FRB99_004830 [Tulasnella sp. 403]|nr:hypothetical protein FRB99_004830 [Tulasnella sp. 403]
MAWFSSFFQIVECEEAVQSQPPQGTSATHNKDDAPGPVNPEKQADATTKSSEPEPEEEAEPEAEAEEEAEEPEDVLPELRDSCKESKACSGFNKHFEHCTEKVTAGEGYKGEDCVEELLMHCVDACVAPKLWAKLK